MAKSRRGLTADLLPHVRDQVGFSDLTIVYQPVVDLQRREVFAFEALVRSPTFNPIQLFRSAIDQDCTGELGRLLRQMAVDGCPGCPLLLNIHPKELDDGWLVRPDDPIFRHEQPVYIEITESVPLSHEAYCHGTLREIRDKGIGLAVDDLGAGYSNLKYIADLEPEIVKLDRMLVANLTVDSRLFKIVRAVTTLCEELGAEVVAEGVETETELESVVAAGVHLVQGFYFARPAEPPPLPDGFRHPTNPVFMDSGRVRLGGI